MQRQILGYSDICFLANSLRQMQAKLDCLQRNASVVGLKINAGKTKIMRIQTECTDPLKLEERVIEDVDSFCYLGVVVTKNGGAAEDIKSRINKARAVYLSLTRV